MANKKAYKDEVKSKNRRTKKTQRKKKQDGFFHSLGSIFGNRVFRSLVLFVFALALGGVGTYLWMSSQPSQDTVLARMKGRTFTVNDVYQSQAGTNGSKQALQEIIFSAILEDKYGDKVSDKKVEDEFNTVKSSYGAAEFSSQLEAGNYTEKSFKATIRERFLQDYAIEAAAKKDMTDKALQDLYKDYNPSVTISFISTGDDKSKAESLKNEMSADGADVNKIVTDNNGQSGVSFDSGDRYDSEKSASLPPTEVQDAAFKVDKDKVSDVIEVTADDNSKTYYVLKVTEKTEKDQNWKNSKKRLQEIFVNKKKTDTTFQKQVMSDLLKEYNVTIEDRDYNSILMDYGLTSSSSSSK